MRTWAIAAVSALVVGMTALPVGGQASDEPEVESVRGDAFGMFVDLFLIDEDDGEEVEVLMGPAPQVALPPDGGGPITDSLDTFVLGDGDDDTVLSGLLEVSTEGSLGPDGYATSTARVENVNTDEAVELPFVADLVEVECRADLVDGPTGSTSIAGGLAEDLEENLVEVPESPEPDTVVVDDTAQIPEEGGVVEASLTVIANEQIAGPSAITVTGVSLSVFAEFVPDDGEPVTVIDIEQVVGQATCGIDVAVADVPTPVRIDPTFTG